MENNQPKSTNSYLIIIVFVAVLAVVGLFLVLSPKKTPVSIPLSSPHSALTAPLPTPPARILTTGEVNLNMVANPKIIKVGQEFTLDLNINPGTFDVIGLETHFTYNPSIISITKVEAGTYLKNGVILVNQNNPQTGRLDYAIASQTKARGTGTIIILHALAVAPATMIDTPNQSIIVFNPKGTKVGLSNPVKNERLGEEQTKVIIKQDGFTITP